MGNELEDFLKRAAQRRAEHVAVRGEQQQREQQRPVQSRAPEYTNRNRERATTRFEDEDEVIVAEVVPAGLAGQSAFPASGLAERHLSSLGEASKVDSVYAPTSSQTPASFENRAVQDDRRGRTEGTDLMSVASPASQGISGKSSSASALVKLLKSPDGVRQAFLMREILDRPVDRW